jgi:hypothetical protein
MKNVTIDENGVRWRVCKICSKKKLYDKKFFAPKNGSRDGGFWLRTECRDCMKQMNKNKRLAEKNASRKRPDACECCGRKPDKGKSLCCDHIHGTSNFRGWICQACNKSIGMAIDDPDIGFEKVIKYYKNYDKEAFSNMKKSFMNIIKEDK